MSPPKPCSTGLLVRGIGHSHTLQSTEAPRPPKPGQASHKWHLSLACLPQPTWPILCEAHVYHKLVCRKVEEGGVSSLLRHSCLTGGIVAVYHAGAMYHAGVPHYRPYRITFLSSSLTGILLQYLTY